MERFDVTSQIKAIELLKCGLLSGLAELYESLRKPTDDASRAEILASVVIRSYLLGKRLGIDYAKLDAEAVLKLRRDILGGAADADTEKLIKHFGRE